MLMSDFDGDVFDRGTLPFLRGGYFAARGFGFQPIASFGAVPRFDRPAPTALRCPSPS